MSEFRERLQRAMLDGNMTPSDLARFLRRPRPTVQGWIAGSELGGGANDRIAVMLRLTQLEKLISEGKQLPIPAGMSPPKRKAYLLELL